jgi:RNA polymerase sigma factor (TIGR02999 family)
MCESKGRVTQLLVAWSGGDRGALEQLAPLVENQLHRLALAYLRAENAGHSLQPTALVNEAYVRLIEWRTVEWQSRAHFFAVAAKMMRRILVSHAERKRRRKRNGAILTVSLSGIEAPAQERSADLLLLDAALEKLAALDERKSRLVELRFFGGLSEEETAEVLQISLRTVQRDWRFARSWLFRELTGGGRPVPQS